MSVLPITIYEDPYLRTKCDPVEKDSEELQQFVDDLFETMYNAHGVGLAAPQVANTSRIFVIDVDAMLKEENGSEPMGPVAFINPEIIKKGNDIVEYEEGCLSIPDIRENIQRPDYIKVKYLDRDFKEQTLEARGWLSRVIQHEYDHIDGVLFIDYLGSFRKRLLRGKLKQMENGEVETEYPTANHVAQE
ncbi:MAG TPA: peptide deformylase [Balneolales bacterium]|nr:peptide deformylase [Balneolales bacterium]